MAYVSVTNSTVWEYDNAATAANTYSNAPGEYGSGIRTFTFPNGNEQEIYVRCRMKASMGNDPDDLERGELSKTFYDAQV